MTVIQILGIIITGNLQIIGNLLSVCPAHIIGADSAYRIAVFIVGIDFFTEHFSYFKTPFARMCIQYLISYAPHNNTRSIPVTGYPAFYIFLVMFIEKSCVVKLGLRYLPHIKALTVNH